MNSFLSDPFNLFLIATAVATGLMLLWPALTKGGGSSRIDSLQATQLINGKNAIVLDVRSAEEFAAGSITGARNIPADKLSERGNEIARFKSRPLILVCQSGRQSQRALEQLRKDGFAEVYNLSGGLAAWQQAGLPLVKGTTGEASRSRKEKA